MTSKDEVEKEIRATQAVGGGQAKAGVEREVAAEFGKVNGQM